MTIQRRRLRVISGHVVHRATSYLHVVVVAVVAACTICIIHVCTIHSRGPTYIFIHAHIHCIHSAQMHTRKVFNQCYLHVRKWGICILRIRSLLVPSTSIGPICMLTLMHNTRCQFPRRRNSREGRGVVICSLLPFDSFLSFHVPLVSQTDIGTPLIKIRNYVDLQHLAPSLPYIVRQLPILHAGRATNS